MSASMVTLILSFWSLMSLLIFLAVALVDTLDDMAEHAHGAARCRLRSIPRDGLEVDAALDELGAQHVDNLLGDKVGRGVDRKELVALRKLDRGAGILKVIALGNLARGLLKGIIDLLHVDLGHDVEAGIFSHDVNPFAYERTSSCRKNSRLESVRSLPVGGGIGAVRGLGIGSISSVGTFGAIGTVSALAVLGLGRLLLGNGNRHACHARRLSVVADLFAVLGNGDIGRLGRGDLDRGLGRVFLLKGTGRLGAIDRLAINLDFNPSSLALGNGDL